MVNIVDMILTNHNNPHKDLIALKKIVLHWTANKSKGANAIANRNFFNSTKLAVSANYIVDSLRVVRCLKDSAMGYAVGSPKYTAYGMTLTKGTMKADKTPFFSPNYFTLNIEICVNADGDFKKTYQNTVDLVVMLLKKHPNLGIDDIITHHIITGKDCPKFMQTDAELNVFRKKVNAILHPVVKPKPIVIKKVKVLVDVLNIRATASAKSKDVGNLKKNAIVQILGESNGFYKIKQGWICKGLNGVKFVKLI